MTDEQFSELMECLREISSRLDEVGAAVSSIEHKTPEYTAYTTEDVCTRLEEVETAVSAIGGIYNIKDLCDRLDEIEKAVTDISHKTPEYTAYTLKDVCEGLWEVEKAVRE